MLDDTGHQKLFQAIHAAHVARFNPSWSEARPAHYREGRVCIAASSSSVTARLEGFAAAHATGLRDFSLCSADNASAASQNVSYVFLGPG